MAFYWQHARDSLITDVALTIFQIAMRYDNCDFDTAKSEIDREYEKIRGTPSNRHGGIFQSQVQAFQEAGWIVIEDGILKVTAVGKQAYAIMCNVPDYLKVIPYFLIDLLSRYQINNPAKPAIRKGEISEQIKESNIFPYWTIWKIMRSCENIITTDELRRFVFRIKDSEHINECITSVKKYRAALSAGASEDDLNSEFPLPLEGAIGEPKYIMARAGTQVGKYQPVIRKPNRSTFELNSDYLTFIDSVLAQEPIFKEQESVEDWMKHYAHPISLEEEYVPFIYDSEDAQIIDSSIDDDDPIYKQVRSLLEDGANSFLLSGSPGTSKSWYARQIALKLVEGDASRISTIQFHPSFGYEDFVEGYIPISINGHPTFMLQPKIFIKAINSTKDGKPAVIIIDEFSRGDVGRIFGEVLTYLEPEYRDQPFTLASGNKLVIPSNLYIIATMNPYDKSVTDIDTALQRRFETIPLKPNVKILQQMLINNSMQDVLIARVCEFFLKCQNLVPFGGLGHAYFLRAKDRNSLERIWLFKIEPMLSLELRYEQDKFDDIKNAFYKVISE